MPGQMEKQGLSSFRTDESCIGRCSEFPEKVHYLNGIYIRKKDQRVYNKKKKGVPIFIWY